MILLIIGGIILHLIGTFVAITVWERNEPSVDDAEHFLCVTLCFLLWECLVPIYSVYRLSKWMRERRQQRAYERAVQGNKADLPRARALDPYEILKRADASALSDEDVERIKRR